MAKVKLICYVCGKECTAVDRNTDGTYAHYNCLLAVQTQPKGKA